MRAHYLHTTDFAACKTEENENNELKRYTNQQLHPRNISNIPGLSPKTDMQEPQNSKYTSRRSFHRPQKQDILRHGEVEESTTPKMGGISIHEEDNSKNSFKKALEICSAEIPLIDQMINHSGGEEKKRDLRPDLLPVDEKMKLYFAYNRTTGSISKVIATRPRGEHFARKTGKP